MGGEANGGERTSVKKRDEAGAEGDQAAGSAGVVSVQAHGVLVRWQSRRVAVVFDADTGVGCESESFVATRTRLWRIEID